MIANPSKVFAYFSPLSTFPFYSMIDDTKYRDLNLVILKTFTKYLGKRSNQNHKFLWLHTIFVYLFMNVFITFNLCLLAAFPALCFTVWKNEKKIYTFRKNIAWNQLFSNSIGKTLLSQNFCQKCKSINFCNFHTVSLMFSCITVWKNHKFALIWKMVREINFPF